MRNNWFEKNKFVLLSIFILLNLLLLLWQRSKRSKIQRKKEENFEAMAVCLSCSNEWAVRDPSVKKKRKCLICGKYRIKLKSDKPGSSKKVSWSIPS
jgi:hypothetical protein